MEDSQRNRCPRRTRPLAVDLPRRKRPNPRLSALDVAQYQAEENLETVENAATESWFRVWNFEHKGSWVWRYWSEAQKDQGRDRWQGGSGHGELSAAFEETKGQWKKALVAAKKSLALADNHRLKVSPDRRPELKQANELLQEARFSVEGAVEKAENNEESHQLLTGFDRQPEQDRRDFRHPPLRLD